MFLTKEDPQAFIKGSRDPLGIQLIWSALGRYVIANLTTQSNSVRGFTILLLGRYLTERFVEERAINKDNAIDVFLRVEQVGAYVRHLGYGVDDDIRGIERVKFISQKNKRKIPIDVGPEGKLLIDQKLYGLWGLFSVPARVSGLIEEGPMGITAEVREFVDQWYWPHLKPAYRPLRELLTNDGGYLNSTTPDRIFIAFKEILSEQFSEEEKHFYGDFIRDGSKVTPYPLKHQRLLAELMSDYVSPEEPLGREQVVLMHKKAASADRCLYEHLDQILRAEAVFATSMMIFEYVLSADQRKIPDLSQVLLDRWGRSIPNIDPEVNVDLLDEINVVYPDSDVADYFNRCQNALADGMYKDVIEILIRWNELIQKRRGGAPWIQLGPQQRLEVWYRSYEYRLPDGDELTNLWRYSYFLPSLQSVTKQLSREAV